jgi:hypothetical protein
LTAKCGLCYATRLVLHSSTVAFAVLALATFARAQTFETPVPLAGGERTLRVARTQVFAPGARIDVVGLDGAVRSVTPADTWFSGQLADDPESTAIVAVGPTGTRGFVAARDGTWWIDRDGVTQAAAPASDAHAGCGGADAVPASGAAPRALADGRANFPPSALLLADLAIETNHELWLQFGADEPTIDFVTTLVAQANVAFERDLNVHLRISYLRLWQTPADPWTGADSTTELTEVRSYWRNPANGMEAIAGPRDVVHLISGRGFSGNIAGRAFLNTVCNPSYGFGYTRTAGRSSPADSVHTFTHELGHSFGSPHSHCYVPPLDRCYGDEGGCYDGPNVPSVGSVMSYCHSFGNGRTLEFHPVTAALIRSQIADATCLAPICEEVETNPEYCDDADSCTIDRCDQVHGCRHEPIPGCCHDAADCDDGSTCTEDVCTAAGQCEHSAVPDGANCSGDLCHPQSCRAGVCTEDVEPHGYAGISCGLLEIDTILSRQRRDMRPGARTKLRTAWRQAYARFRAASKARASGKLAVELRAANRLAKSLRRLETLVRRFEDRGRVRPNVVHSLRSALGSAQRSTAGVQASLASPSAPDRP